MKQYLSSIYNKNKSKQKHMENLQLIIDQFLPSEHKIVKASAWYQLHEGKNCVYSSPSELEFIEELLAMCADSIRTAHQF